MIAELITSPIARRYLTGFSSSAGTIVLCGEARYFIIDSRYYEAAKREVRGFDVLLQDKLYEQLVGILREHGASEILAETEHLAHAEFLRLREKLAGFTLLDSDELSKRLSHARSVKHPAEIAKIEAAVAIADRAFERLVGELHAGMSEREIARRFCVLALEEGADGLAFETIAALGENSSVPHHSPSDRRLRETDILLLDFGVRKDGYCSDKTRTLAFGEQSSEFYAAYAAVAAAKAAAERAIADGEREAKEIDKLAREAIAAAGFGEFCYSHGLSHGVGLEVHEAPSVSSSSNDVLEAGNVISVEPGIYIPGKLGIRIEDLLFV